MCLMPYANNKGADQPRHDKTNKMPVRPARTPATAQSDQSIRCPHEESLGH